MCIIIWLRAEVGWERKRRRKKRRGDIHGKQDADTVIKIIRNYNKEPLQSQKKISPVTYHLVNSLGGKEEGRREGETYMESRMQILL